MGRQNWRTPEPVFDELSATFGPFDLDAAADRENHLCQRYYTEEDDVLSMPWFGRVWVNIPFGDPMPWVEKAIEERLSGRAACVVMLCCANISARWFHLAWGHAGLLVPTSRIAYWHPDQEPGSFDRDSALFVFMGSMANTASPWRCPPHNASNRRQWQEANGQGSLL